MSLFVLLDLKTAIRSFLAYKQQLHAATVLMHLDQAQQDCSNREQRHFICIVHVHVYNTPDCLMLHQKGETSLCDKILEKLT